MKAKTEHFNNNTFSAYKVLIVCIFLLFYSKESKQSCEIDS